MPELPDLGSSLPEVAIRTALVYLVLLALLRLAGKREVGQLSVIDLLVLLLIADAVQNAMVGDNDTLLGGVVAAAVLIGLDRVLAIAIDRWKWARKAIEGEPRLLVHDGKVLRKAMHAEGIDEAELRAAIRKHGVEKVEDVRLAVLEADGQISVISRSGEEPGDPTERPGL